MSVYHEAILTGRISRSDVFAGRGTSQKPAANRPIYYGGISRVLREVRRDEAEERNARSPWARTAAARRAGVRIVRQEETK